MLRTLLLCLVSAAGLYGQVTVAETLKVAAGNQNFNGTVTITSPAMTYSGVVYLPGTKTVSVSNGAFTTTVWPNYGATPTNTTYRVTYTPRQTGGEPISPWTELWEVIPTNCTSPTACTVTQVRKAGSITNPSGSPLSNPLTTAGDLLYFNSGIKRLPIGTTGQQLVVAAGLPAWAASVSEPIIAAGTTAQYWRGDKSWQTLNKAAVGLTNVEDTALSTWTGSNYIATLKGFTLGIDNYLYGGTTSPFLRLSDSAGSYLGYTSSNIRIIPGEVQITVDYNEAARFLGTNLLIGQTTNPNNYKLAVAGVIAASGGFVGNVTGTATGLSSTLSVATGGTGLDNSAATGFQRFASGTPSVSGLANADLPSAFDISGKTSTKPIKSGTLAPGTCAVGEVFFDTDATAGGNILLCTSTNTWTAVTGGGGSLTTYAVAAFTASFTTQTSVTLSHNFNSTKQAIACYDGSNQWIEPLVVTLGLPSSTVTFSAAQTGSCTVIGGTGLYDESFTGQTSINLDHDLNTYAVIVKCYDGSENEIEPNTVAAAGLNDTTVTFSNSQTGHCSVASTLPGGGGGGGTGTVTSVGLSLPAELTVTGSPVTTSGTLAATWASQTAGKFLASPSGSSGAMSARVIAAADVPVLVGDSGSGGTQGAAPAPATGDAAAGKYLKADGTWAVPPGGGGSGDVTNLSATSSLTGWTALTAAGTAGACEAKNVTLTGAVSGDVVVLGPPSTIGSGFTWSGKAGSNLVVVTVCNGITAQTPGDGTWKVMVLRSTI